MIYCCTVFSKTQANQILRACSVREVLNLGSVHYIRQCVCKVILLKSQFFEDTSDYNLNKNLLSLGISKICLGQMPRPELLSNYFFLSTASSSCITVVDSLLPASSWYELVRLTRKFGKSVIYNITCQTATNITRNELQVRLKTTCSHADRQCCCWPITEPVLLRRIARLIKLSTSCVELSSLSDGNWWMNFLIQHQLFSFWSFLTRGH
jgi:hypothetical protein